MWFQNCALISMDLKDDLHYFTKLMSALILKCHKMLLMSHLDKTVINIGYYYQ